MKKILLAITMFVFAVPLGFAQTAAGVPSQPASGADHQGTAAQNAGQAASNPSSSRGSSDQAPQSVTLSPGQTQQQDNTSDVADLLAPRPLPPNPTLSLIGGSIVTLDRVRNRMMVQPFGGDKKMRIDFDERSHIYRDGVETTSLGLHKGDRVYVDTMLNGSQVFARNINIETTGANADVQGQLESVDLRRKIFAVRDKLTDQPISLRFDSQTKISYQGRSGSAGNLIAGALVSVHFVSQGAGRPMASVVNVMADPGRTYVFYGEISHIDKRQNAIAVRSATGDGDRFYDISVERTGVPNDLRIGATVKVLARFDGQRYVAQQISIEPARMSGNKSQNSSNKDQQQSPAGPEKQ